MHVFKWSTRASRAASHISSASVIEYNVSFGQFHTDRPYLADRHDIPRTNQAIDEGLAWATAKINETVALLGQIFTGSDGPVFEAFDYLIDQLTHTNTSVPDPMWALALEQAESSELLVVGLAAYGTGKLVTAETAWRQAADKGNSEVAPRAAFNLGVLREGQGDVEGAKAAYQQAIDSRHAEAAPNAAVNLERLLRSTPPPATS